MKWFHSVIISVFIKPEEDYELIKQKFIALFPFSLEDNKLAINETSASTFENRIIKILEIKLTKESLISQLLKDVLSRLSKEDIDMMIRQIETRVDSESNFFFRLSKTKLLFHDLYLIVDHGNCFHFKCHVAAFPQNQEKAIITVKNYLISKYVGEKSD